MDLSLPVPAHDAAGTDRLGQELTLASPIAALDLDALDPHAEGAALRKAGPVAPVALPGRPGDRVMTAWAVTDYEVARTILDDDDTFVKNPQAWHAYRDGLVPKRWPLLKVIAAGTLLNYDGADHRRLRRLVTSAFTHKRITELTPRIEEIAHRLVAELPVRQTFDLRAGYAFRLPMEVICELIGLDARLDQQKLADAFDRFLNSHTTEEEFEAAQTAVAEALAALVARKRATPGEDLTSALLQAHDEGHHLNEQELLETLFLLLIAGLETTQNLITNALVNLLDHPDQLGLALDGAVDYAAVAKETLRYDSPLNTLMFRFARRTVQVGDVTIQEGEAILFALAAIGRAPSLPDADRFRVDRPAADMRHLSFSHGVHYCLGAPLALIETEVALRVLLGQRQITSHQSRAELPRIASLSTHCVASLPLTLAHKDAD
ncbi:cytochrome P450 [Streptomyces sp. NPDC059037]|uniref:cytochrome P450 n=1 Tax=Streptomyces sp. NPDC059037 TaxID=3346710 RepID=UPI0036CB18C5